MQQIFLAPPLPLDDSQVGITVFNFGQRQYYIEDYLEEIDKASYIRIYLHANVLELEAEINVNHVTAVNIYKIARNQCLMCARFFVLALGGIETPRLLLLSKMSGKRGLAISMTLLPNVLWNTPIFRPGSSFQTILNFIKKLVFMPSGMSEQVMLSWAGKLTQTY